MSAVSIKPPANDWKCRVKDKLAKVLLGSPAKKRSKNIKANSAIKVKMAATTGCCVMLEKYKPSAEKLATISNKPMELATMKPKSMSAQIFKVDNMAPMYTTKILKKATKPKNLPKTISVNDKGALNRNGKV